PKYIAEEFIKQKLDYKLVWLVRDMSSVFPKEIKKVKYGSLRAYFELATAKIWIDNIRNGLRTPKKKKQFYIQTWHGSIPLKKIERAAEDLLDKGYIKKAKKDGKITNLMLSNSKWATELYRNDFWYNGPILEAGVPREDVLVGNVEIYKKKVLDFFNVQSNTNIVLYAPTFRQVRNMQNFTFDYEAVVQELERKFNDNYVILIRLHPNDAMLYKNIKETEKVKNASAYPDMQELLLASNILITDYSSTMFEFSILNKMVLIFARDLEDYLKTEREMYFNILDLPFPIARNDEELINTIKELNQDSYKAGVDAFLDQLGYCPLGGASFAVVDYIKKLA
ncbi:MAG: CDP-glycerol glycerophosphotransferase family protein, partial [Anaeroplasmataceae bacterium]|nr:CDP-glycerol glycerophosphotransferase family protein [Anaeroplasmataceae bacterium]